jgi:hypothetical protein
MTLRSLSRVLVFNRQVRLSNGDCLLISLSVHFSRCLKDAITILLIPTSTTPAAMSLIITPIYFIDSTLPVQRLVIGPLQVGGLQM